MNIETQNPSGDAAVEKLAPAKKQAPVHKRIISARITRGIFGVFTVCVAVIASYYALVLVSPTDVTVGPVRAEFSLKPALHGLSLIHIYEPTRPY